MMPKGRRIPKGEIFVPDSLCHYKPGDKVNRLTIKGGAFWARLCGRFSFPRRQHHVCVCDCGSRGVYCADDLRKGSTKSCGCLRTQMAARRLLTARRRKSSLGLSRERLNSIWASMVARCHNPKHKAYKTYGARGISVCDEWRNSYIAFREWSHANGYREPLAGERKGDTLSIDRIDNSAGYSPGNCQWLTIRENTKKMWSDMADRVKQLESECNELRSLVVTQNALISALAGLA